MTFRVVRRVRTLSATRVLERFLLELDDDNATETSLIGDFGPRLRTLARMFESLAFVQKRIRYAIAIATQVGCGLGCRYCPAAEAPFVRNLSTEEMLRQIATIEVNIPKGGRLSEVRFSGIGEPLLNYDGVANVIRALSRRGISARINTSGLVPGLERLFADRLECALSVSIPEADDARKKLARVLEHRPDGMRVEVEHLMLRGLNDSLDHARALAAFVEPLSVTVGLRTYSHIPARPFDVSSEDAVRAFSAELSRLGIMASVLDSEIGAPLAGDAHAPRKRLTVIQ